MPLPSHRLHRLSIAATLLVLAGLVHAGTFVYVSDSEDGDVATYRLDTATGALQPGPRAPAAKLVMPMASLPAKGLLYAAARSKPYTLFTYRIDPASGQLSALPPSPLPESMVNIAVDPTGRFLFGAAYGANSASVSPIGADGTVGQPSQYFATGGVKPHKVHGDNSGRFVYAPHLGTDEIREYRLDTAQGRLEPLDPPAVKLPPGTGPRHFAISPDNRFYYQLSQLSGTITVLAIQPDGTLKLVREVSALPAGHKLVRGEPRPPVSDPSGVSPENDDNVIWTADIHMTPDGRFLYVSERTTSSLNAFGVDPATGELRFIGSYPTEKQPRGFAIEPDGRFLIAAGERSTALSVYRIQPDGSLALAGKAPVGKGANWVEVVKLP